MRYSQFSTCYAKRNKINVTHLMKTAVVLEVHFSNTKYNAHAAQHFLL